MIYLDNNATTQVAPEVVSEMKPFLENDYANPSSLHGAGQKVRRAVEEARDQVARSLGLKSSRGIIFTSGGTESNNTAIRSALKANPHHRRIVTSVVEHSSVKYLCEEFQKKDYEVIFIGVGQTGAIDWNALEQALTSEVAVVSVMWVNNETGVIFPIEPIAELTHGRGILLHVDAVQAAGKLPIDLSKIPVDYVSVSAHKFHGPKGIGALYVREGAPYHPLLIGGSQERARRAGTENVSGIIGLAHALKMAYEQLDEVSNRIQTLRDYFERELLRLVPDSFVNGKAAPRVFNTTNVTIPEIHAETFLIRLSELGICASAGSACLTGALEPSHVLTAMGHSREFALGSVRLSLSRYTTPNEIDRARELIPPLVEELRGLKAH